MKEGLYLDYEGSVSDIYFYFFNESLIPKPLLNISGSKILGGNAIGTILRFERGTPVRISLFLKKLNGSLGIFETTLKIDTYSSTVDLQVNLTNRDVFLLNGTCLGKTILWIPTCKEGDVFPYVGEGDLTVFATALDGPTLETPQSLQDSLMIDASEHQSRGYVGIPGGEIITPLEAQSSKHFSPRDNFYDADTFIMLRGDIDQDAFISAFNIIHVSAGDFILMDTNADLGPPNLIAVLLGLVINIIPIAIIILVVFYFTFMKRRRGRRTR
ncbi:MAG: hypothetical protein ACUVQ0_06080 [Thermoproteota archaeon]